MEVSLSDLYQLEADRENSSDNSGDNSPSSTTFASSSSISSPKRSRRGIQKRVVTIPIKDVEASRFKSGDCTPPSDSWAWRKYGQKPIKGSPYPRGYYRCSSSKGCPARKQVERSRSDPNMLVITYSYEHNHPWPASRSNNHQNRNKTPISPTPSAPTISTNNDHVITHVHPKIEINHDHQTMLITTNNNNPHEADPPREDHVGTLMNTTTTTTTDELSWFSTDHHHHHHHHQGILNDGSSFLTSCDLMSDLDMAKIFPMMGAEDESLFADLGELPECSVVFRQAEEQRQQQQQQQCSFTAPWCGSTG